MKHATFLLGLAALLALSIPARAQDVHSPEEQIEFIRKLRDKGYHDLAMEKLEMLQKNPPASLQQILSFELAKTRLLLARGLDPEERFAIVERARADLEDFLKKNPQAPEAPVARLDLKRLAGEQGQAMLSLALRQRGVNAKQEKAKLAEKFFIQAEADLQSHLKEVTDVDQRRQTLFDLAVNKMEQARTYIAIADEDIRDARSKKVAQARVMFEALAKEDTGRLGYLCKAWLIKCCEERETADPQVANRFFDELKKATSRDAEEAWRLARYFQLSRTPLNVSLYRNMEDVDKFKKVQVDADLWLKSYPAFFKSPIGYGVRYELASALYNEGRLLKDIRRQTTLFDKAQQVLYSLNEGDNDLIGKVADLRSRIARVHIASKKDVSVAELGTFDLCCIRAGMELDRIQNVRKQIEEASDEQGKKKLDKELQEHVHAVVASLNRALTLADKRTPNYAIENVRYDLLKTYAFLDRARTPYRTAIFGESLARANPPHKIGPLAAEHAVDAYARIVSLDPSPSSRERLRDLAQFVLSPERQKLWEKEDVVPLAHFQLALLDQGDATLLFAQAERLKDEGRAAALKAALAKFQEAVDHLRKLPKEQPRDVSRYFYAQGKAVFLALGARDKVSVPEEKKYYRDLARTMANSLPPLPPKIDPVPAEMYFHARMEEAKFLYEDAAEFLNTKDAADPLNKKGAALALQKYKEMATFLNQIEETLKKTEKFDAARRAQLEYYIGTMRKYSAFGLADLEYQAGNYARVLEPDATGNVVELVKKEAARAPKNPIVRLKDHQITGQILSLALRANVEQGKIEEARAIMHILENLKDVKDNLFTDSTGVLRNLTGQLDVHIHELERTGDRARLKVAVENFTKFVDTLVKDADKRPLDKKEIFFGRCYDILDQHDKAAKLYVQYPAPKHLEVVKKDKERFSDDEERELQTYWFAQVMLAKQLRLSKKADEAKKILDGQAAHKNARQYLQAERERIYLLEDAALFGTAIRRWNDFLVNPNLKTKDLGVDLEKKKIYFDAYYHRAYCWYKYSQSEKVKAAGKEAQFLANAVNNIVRLETSTSPEGWQLVGHKFRELLQSEPVLNKAYEKQKAGGG